MAGLSSEPRATDLLLKRQRPADRALSPGTSEWALQVHYRAGSRRVATRLSLSSGDVALRVDRLLAAMRMGNRSAARDLYACLHIEWGLHHLVHRDVAWDAVFRYLAPLAADAEPDR